MSYAAEATLVAYAFCNALRVFSYVPQIIRIARDREGAKAISLASWWLWIAANASTMLYAWINLRDAPLALLNGFNTVACLIVVCLTMWKRISVESGCPTLGATRIARPGVSF